MAGAVTVFGQQEMTITSPIVSSGINQGNIGGTFQLGAELPFVGTYDTPEDCDSISCNIYYALPSWAPHATDFRVFDVVEKGTHDGVIDNVVTIPADWRPQTWNDTTGQYLTGDNQIRPLLQVQRFFGQTIDTTWFQDIAGEDSAINHIDTNGVVTNFAYRTCDVIEAYADSLSMDNDALVDGAFAGEYVPGTTIDLGTGKYGVTGADYIEYRIAYRDAGWATVGGHEYITYGTSPLGGNANSGSFDAQIPVDADFPTADEMDLAAGEFVNIRVGLLSGGEATWTFLFFNVSIVDVLTDSLYVEASNTSIEYRADYEAGGTATVQITGFTYPSQASRIFEFSVSDTNIATIDQNGVLTPKDLPLGSSQSVYARVKSITAQLSDSIEIQIQNYINTCPGCIRDITLSKPFVETGIDLEPYGGGVIQRNAIIQCSGIVNDYASIDRMVISLLFYADGINLTNQIDFDYDPHSLFNEEYSFDIVVPETISLSDENSVHYLKQSAYWDSQIISDSVMVQVIEAQESTIFMANPEHVDGYNLGEYYRGEYIDIGLGYHGIINAGYTEQQLFHDYANGTNVYTGNNDIFDMIDPNDGILLPPLYYVENDVPIMNTDRVEAGETQYLQLLLWDESYFESAEFRFKLSIVETKTDSVDAWFGDDTDSKVVSLEYTGQWEEKITGQINAINYPAEAIQHITYLSANTGVARVDEAGVITPTGVGEVKIYATSTTANICDSVIITVTNDIIYSVDDYMIHSNVQVYPNPATSELNIVGIEQATIKIYNLLGAQLMSTELEGTKISVDALPAGTYVLSIINNDETIVRKISIQ